MLNLFPPQSLRRFPLPSEWRCLQGPASAEGSTAYVRPDFDDSDWSLARVPAVLSASTDNDTVWYRCRFAAPPDVVPSRRYLLRFGGVYLEAEVWLNGERLGGHYGYFASFAFDVTEHLHPEDNVLVVRARCMPEQANLKAKKHVLGIFGEWDCKPYPNYALANPLPGREWAVPLGLWREGTLEETGSVVANWVRLTPVFPDADWRQAGERLESSALVHVAVELHNLAAEPRAVALESELKPANFAGDERIRDRRQVELGGHEVKELTFSLLVPNPALWWPWTHGEPLLYNYHLSAELAAGDGGGEPCFALDRLCGLREVSTRCARSATEKYWEWWLNGRRIFPKGSNYVSEFWMDRANEEGYERDLALARAANMDILRVHAHVEKEEFYRLADEQGVMLMCDFPLIFCHVFGAPAEDKAFFREAVLAGLPEMVNMLASHPSIVLWVVHNEPPWPNDMAWFGEPHTEQTNRDVDEEGARLVAALDRSRPVMTASGDVDEHLYNGWYHGNVEEFRTLAPVFPTEFGAQSLPGAESPFWQTLPTTWPIEAEDPSWIYADYQPVQWSQHGVGEPGSFGSLADYIKASQEYQAFYCQYAIELWRAGKFRPTGGLVQFMFADCWPSITWSIVDYYRLPKLAYRAIGVAYNPVHVCIIFEADYAVRDRRIAYRGGTPSSVDLYVVNDDYRLSGPATLAWRIEPVWAELPLLSRLRLLVTGRPGGARHLRLPGAEERAFLALTVSRNLPRGAYTVVTELWQEDRLLDRNEATFQVVGKIERPPGVRQVPGFAARRVYVHHSLRNTDEGSTFAVRNTYRDGQVERLLYLRVDGRNVPLDRIRVDLGEGAVNASAVTVSAPVNIRKGTVVSFYLPEVRLSSGSHQIEVAVQVAGLGQGVMTIKDRV
ncbi:MAG: glycoside hydrolase family 2 protein [Chloroflexota bacterium]